MKHSFQRQRLWKREYHYMHGARSARQKIWSQLEPVARPDSRFHLDFSEIIPDFEGSAEATDRAFHLPAIARARYAFVTPDNGLIEMRRRMIEAGITMVVSTFNIRRGFLLVDPVTIPVNAALYAAWLDGLEHFGKPATLAEIAELGRFDVMITGASAVSFEGVRFGKGHIFFDIEWGIFSDLGLVDQTTPVITLVHDLQVVDDRLFPAPTDILVDTIVTPTRVLEVETKTPRPRGVRWKDLDPDLIDMTPPLLELRRLRGMTR
jgi:5-formyltetrahydrofolate cyclo-ligase